MWYMPYVRVRRAVAIYSLFVVAVALVVVAVRFWPGNVHLDVAGTARFDGVHISLAMVLSGAAALVGGLATVLGLNLAAENDGHLELAWTKPVSRDGYALGVFAVDIAAMVVCIAFTVVIAAIVVDIVVGHQAIDLDFDRGLLRALAYCGLPLCIYAWIAALSASFKRNRGSVAGLFWPVMAVLAFLAALPFTLVHTIASALDTINPLVIYTTSSHGAQTATATFLSGWAVAVLLLLAALAQWRRLEI